MAAMVRYSRCAARHGRARFASSHRLITARADPVKDAVTSRRAARGKPGGGSRRRRRTWALVGLAVVIAAGFMITRTAQAIVSATPCRGRPVVLRVAVTAELAPSVQRVAQLFNRQRHAVGSSCARAEVVPGSSAAQAAQIDGQHSGGTGAAADAWIPDSSLWVDLARGFPVGAQRIQPTGISAARSPLMIVMPAAAADRIPAFGASVRWDYLLPSLAGGPAASLGVRIELPDPVQSAAGLATLVQMGRLLGTGHRARAAFTRFVYNCEVTGDFDSRPSLASFVRQAAPPLNGRPATITTEQAVIQYDRARPGQPLAARYPVGASARLGTPELDYPYVLTTSDPAAVTAARLFGTALRQPYATAVIRYDGFRSANGVADTFPASFGLSRQILQLAPPIAASKAQSTLQVWNRLELTSRDLALVDASPAMAGPSGIAGVSIGQELVQAAGLGLALFPDSTDLGVWQMPGSQHRGQAYQRLVPVGPLTGDLGLISRRTQLEQVIRALRPQQGGTLALHRAILAGYSQMVASYQPDYANAVLLLTSGVDSDPRDLPLRDLLTRLHRLASPARPVEIIAIMFGRGGDFSALRQIAAATGGSAHEITRPSQIGRVFFSAVASRLCATSCAAP